MAYSTKLALYACFLILTTLVIMQQIKAEGYDKPIEPVDPTQPAPCRQHLGECMSFCNIVIQRPSTDCPIEKVCCVLV